MFLFLGLLRLVYVAVDGYLLLLCISSAMGCVN